MFIFFRRRDRMEPTSWDVVVDKLLKYVFSIRCKICTILSGSLNAWTSSPGFVTNSGMTKTVEL